MHLWHQISLIYHRAQLHQRKHTFDNVFGGAEVAAGAEAASLGGRLLAGAESALLPSACRLLADALM